MKSIFESSTREELVSRIQMLHEGSTAQWGKMNINQMLKHCTLFEEMISGKNKYKRVFMGRIFGKLALRNILKNDKPLFRNTPTVPELRVVDSGDFLTEKNKWIELIRSHEHFPNETIIHPFFGKVTKQEIGIHAYKHSDHHLRQFNC